MALLGKLFSPIARPLGRIANDVVPMHEVGHVLNDIGQTAGNILAPKLMAAIPGTQLHQAFLNHVAQQQQMKQDALTAREGLENAEAGYDTARMNALENPVPKPQKMNTPQQDAEDAAYKWDLQHGMNPAEAEQSVYGSQTRGEGPKYGEFTLNGKSFRGYDTPKGVMDVDTQQLVRGAEPFLKPSSDREDAFHEWLSANPGKNYNDFMAAQQAARKAGDVGLALERALNFRAVLQHAYSDNPALLPLLPQLAARMGIKLSPEEATALSTPPAGWQYDPVTGKPLGKSSPEFAKGQTVQRMQFSQEVLPTIHSTIQEIKSHPNLVGVVSGRINDIWSGKLGSPNAPYYQLLTNLHNLATAWSKIHTDTDKARQEFTQLLGSAQSPQNLIAGLDAIKEQMDIYANYHLAKPNETMPKIGQIKTFPNGKKGRFDGHGWVLVR